MLRIHSRRRKTPIAVLITLMAIWLGVVGTTVPWTEAFAEESTGAPATFSPIADTSVVQSAPADNFGTRNTLVADGEPISQTYLMFDISGLPGAVTSAKVRLYVKDSSVSGGSIARMSNVSWSEASVTYATRPTVDGTTIATLGSVTSGTWVEFDVTSAVSGNGPVSFGIVTTRRDGVDYASREDTANAPQLVVTTSAGGTTNPPPPATPTPSPTPPATPTPSPSPTTTPTAPVTPGPGSAIVASAETTPVRSSGDAADDPAIWVNPTDSSLSTVIGTDKRTGGLAVYDLSGRELFWYANGRPNNVDIRQGVNIGGATRDIVAVSEKDSDDILIYQVDSSTRGLVNLTGSTSTGVGVDGFCLYASRSGALYGFVSDTSGNTEQHELRWNSATGKIDSRVVRKIKISGTGEGAEGCVADDENGRFFIAPDVLGIYRYDAEPTGSTTPYVVDRVGAGRLTADVEGLTLYRTASGGGYLIASSQGSDTYVAYDRQSPHTHRLSFKVEAGAIDATSHTDGIDVTNAALGSAFPEGMLVVQDDRNDSGNQNFKLISWGLIARAASPPLTIDTGLPVTPTPEDPKPDTTPPDTAILSGPTGTVTATDANFTFSSTESGSTFECSLDAASFGPCASPASYSSLSLGNHAFRVRATDSAGNVDSSPAERAWTAASKPVTGATYYLDSIGGNDANAGTSEATAWKSLAKATNATFGPGDQLLLRRGGRWTGKLEITESGTSSSPITIGTYGSGDKPLISGGSTGVTLKGSYLRLSDLQVVDCSWAGVQIEGSYNRLENSVIMRNAAGIYIKSGATYNAVIGNTIADNNRMSVLTVKSGDDSGAFGVLIHGDYSEIANNTISGSDAFSYDYGRDGAAIEIYGGQYNTVHHNLAVDNDAFAELGNSRAKGNTFAYNVVRSSLDQSTFLVVPGSLSSRGPATATGAFNNTVYLTGGSSQGVICYSGCSSSVLSMRNNVIHAVLKAGYADKSFDEDYNVFSGGKVQIPALGAHSRVANPMFVNPSVGDLRPRAGSPLIDAGVGLQYTHDANGQPVPIDGNGDGKATPDIGAYEFAPGKN